MSVQEQNLDNNLSGGHIHSYIEGLLEVEQKTEHLDNANIQENQPFEKTNNLITLNDILIITIGSMNFAINADEIDCIKTFDNRLKVYADQASCILGQTFFSEQTISIIKAGVLHPNILENSKNKEKKLLVFNQASYGLLCDEVSYLENVNKKELVLFEEDLIKSWFIGVYKEKLARILDVEKFINLLGLE